MEKPCCVLGSVAGVWTSWVMPQAEWSILWDQSWASSLRLLQSVSGSSQAPRSHLYRPQRRGGAAQLFLPTSFLESGPTLHCTIVLRASRLRDLKLCHIDVYACRCTETREKILLLLKRWGAEWSFSFSFCSYCYAIIYVKTFKTQEKEKQTNSLIHNMYFFWWYVEWDFFQRLYLCQL